jgi:hypothetical protein
MAKRDPMIAFVAFLVGGMAIHSCINAMPNLSALLLFSSVVMWRMSK